MPAATKAATPRPHRGDSSFVSILSGWVEQGVHSFFATQRILMDLAMKQNASVMHALRQQLSDPHHSPTAILGEVAEDGITNFIEGQKILLDLGKQQNEILMSAVKERVGDFPPGRAVTDLLRRSVDTFIHMQHEFLKMAEKQTHTWVEATKAGKPFDPEQLVGVARDGMENFVKAQKEFLDIIADETAKATNGKHADGIKKMKKTELTELAHRATESFVGAQKKLADVAGKQMNANIKTVENAVDLLKPFPIVPFGELTREAVKSYVDAQKALMDAVMKPPVEHKAAAKRARKAGAKKEAVGTAA